jgi:hypothetical protein
MSSKSKTKMNTEERIKRMSAQLDALTQREAMRIAKKRKAAKTPKQIKIKGLKGLQGLQGL